MNPAITESAVHDDIDPLLSALLEALHRADTSHLALSLCDEIVSRANRDSLRLLIKNRLHQLVPVATEPAAGLICALLGLTVEQVTSSGRPRWMLSSEISEDRPTLFASAPDAHRGAVLGRYPRNIWESKVDRGTVRIRYWAWALVEALKALEEAPQTLTPSTEFTQVFRLKADTCRR